MKLFVWTEFCPDWAYGLAFAIAETIQQAQELVIAQYGYKPSEWGPCQEFDLDTPRAFSVYGGS